MLLDAVRSGVALLTWHPDAVAYASAFSEATQRYAGLVGSQHPDAVLDATSALVKPDIAAIQIEAAPKAPEQVQTPTVEIRKTVSAPTTREQRAAEAVLRPDFT